MAHFAEIVNNKVVRVIVVNNNDILHDGNESELKGIEFLKKKYGRHTKWVQTSFSASFRGKFAGIGDTYDATTNEFKSINETT